MDITKFHQLDIVLLCGLYGSGKTEFAIKYFKGQNRNRVSRTEIRKYMYEMTNFGEHWDAGRFTEESDALVKHIERKILEHFLHFKQNVLIINTFVSKKSRKSIIELAHQMKKTIGAIFLQRPLEQCIERNKNNIVEVPQQIIYAMHNKIELPEKNEGFNEVLILNYK